MLQQSHVGLGRIANTPFYGTIFTATFFTATLFALSGIAVAETIQNQHLSVSVDAAQQRFTVTELANQRVFMKNGQFTHPIVSVEVQAVADPIWGDGQQVTVQHMNEWTTLLRLYPQHPFVHILTRAINHGEEPVEFSKIKFWECEYDLGIPVDQLRILGTGGLSGAEAEGSYAFATVVDPGTRSGLVSGWLTHQVGLGVFLPTVRARRTFLMAQGDYGQLQLGGGVSRQLDTAVIGYFADARLGLEAYADAVARQFDIHLPQQPSLYCTWYHGGASNQQKMAENVEFAAEHLVPFGLSAMQIDDKWQSLLPNGFQHAEKIRTTGPIKVFVDTNDRYPDGMAHTARVIAQHGMTPGLWFMPFAGNFRHPYFDPDLFAKQADGLPFHDERWSGTCLDLSNPKTQAFVRQRVKRIYDWGYRYFKLDGMHTGAPSYNIYVNKGYRPDTIPQSKLADPRVTPVEAYRKGLKIVRETAPDAFVLGCNVSQNMVSMGPAFGMIDAMRIGPDNGSAGRGELRGVKAGAWHGSTLYFLNGRVWHNDPDPVYVRETTPLHMARLMCSWVAVSGTMLTTSYQFSELPAERLDLLKRTMPGHGLCGRPADLFEAEQARVWLLTDDRSNVRRDVIGLFNWSEKEPLLLDYDFGRLGLDPHVTYALFDFWANRFIEPAAGKLEQTIPAASCCVLAARPVADHPQLLSTSRHIAQCMVDVLDENWDAPTRTLSGRSKVVAGDPYELRIAFPVNGRWAVAEGQADDAVVSLGRSNELGARVSILSEEGGEVHWSVRF